MRSSLVNLLSWLLFLAVSLFLMVTFSIDSKVENLVAAANISQTKPPFLTVEPKTKQSVNLDFKTTDFKPREDLENQMISLVNHERVSRGINPLTFDPDLQIIARKQSADMFERGYFSHYSPEGQSVADRAAIYKIDYQIIGENLAYAPSLELAHKGLMNSPGHRDNILSKDYNKIGIGIADGGSFGLMITQVFSN